MSLMTRTAVWNYSDDLRALLDQIWESLTETPNALDFSEPTFSVPDGTEMMRAQVALHGDWEGAVRILCEQEMAERIASFMLAQPQSELDPADVDDALGEVANIIGGNVKSLLDGVEKLSLPEVARFMAPDHLSGEHLHACVARWGDLRILVEVEGQN